MTEVGESRAGWPCGEVVPNAPFVQPDGTPYRLDKDYSGAARDAANPAPGPFEFTTDSTVRLRVWPKE